MSIVKRGTKAHAEAVIMYDLVKYLHDLGWEEYSYKGGFGYEFVGKINDWLLKKNIKRHIIVFTSNNWFTYWIINSSEFPNRVMKPKVVEKTDVLEVAVMYALDILLLSIKKEINEKTWKSEPIGDKTLIPDNIDPELILGEISIT
jgi:hypothetical protein